MKKGDLIKTHKEKWMGRVVRQDKRAKIALIEWEECGGGSTDVMTWVCFDDMEKVEGIPCSKMHDSDKIMRGDLCK